ncbi:hypothetical protein BU25DRAFT_9015 [Macroventuria anomochaeta]|uniref:Uncharacterized protein n=1 Tax=Macroventuria anomochaeta TaxID=301207 RepID=A0ACB6SHF3_9PLEO|nr:uncharacterized protein BU25DRAFT_9015 [Macroventuria anomochaeta]KAF2633596.1 hypothetical protein BU25DRAFT_9015 [Macroventuria anomochaeta]
MHLTSLDLCPFVLYTPNALLVLLVLRSACEGCGGWTRYGYPRFSKVKTTTRQSLLSPGRWLFDEESGSTLLIVGRCEVTVTLGDPHNHVKTSRKLLGPGFIRLAMRLSCSDQP